MRKTIGILIVTMLVLLIGVTPIFATATSATVTSAATTNATTTDATATSASTQFNAELSATATTVDQGGNVQVTVKLKDFTANKTGINAIKAKIDYDKTVFDTLATTDLTSANGWDTPTFNPANGEFVMDNNTFMAQDHDLLTFNFHVKNTAAVGSTVITFGDTDASDGVSDIYTADQSITLTITKSANPNLSNNNGNTSDDQTNSNNNYTAYYVIIALLVIVVVVLIADILFMNKKKNNSTKSSDEK